VLDLGPEGTSAVDVRGWRANSALVLRSTMPLSLSRVRDLLMIVGGWTLEYASVASLPAYLRITLHNFSSGLSRRAKEITYLQGHLDD
jgi:hypothetical protein